MLKTILQLHSVHLGLSVNSVYPVSLSSGKKFTDRGKISLLHGNCLLCHYQLC